MAFCLVLSICAQSAWIDVTDQYIKNPRYDNNNYGYWEGTQLTGANPKENAEHYQRYFDTYQILSGLKPGKYRLSLNAFYRMGNSSNDYYIYSNNNTSNYEYAQLYAASSLGDYSVPIKCASSGATSSNLGGATSQVGNGWQVKYIPNNMEAAYYWFQAGYYKNTVECEVASDGNLTIGIRKYDILSEDWTCLDNWKLEYYTTIVPTTSVTLGSSSLNMVAGEERQLKATVLPDDATYKTVKWSSSNTTVAIVTSAGIVKALKNGTVTISAIAQDDSSIKASCAITITNPVAPTLGSLIINEVMASNIDVYRDPSTNFGSWVELYNPTADGVTLGGLTIEMTDADGVVSTHKLVSTYGVLPANGYAMLNFDHYENYTKEAYRQIDDKLDMGGGTVRILNGATVLASFTYPAGMGRMSYARTTDGGDTWSWTGTPTPLASNSAAKYAETMLDAPVVNKMGQIFSGTLSCVVTIPAGCTLRYTTDGTAPTETNGEISTTGRFTINNTTCYRFRLFQDGMLPSPVVTRSFISNNNNEPFPIISLVTDRKNIFSDTYSIFEQSEYGRPGNGQDSKCNWNMGWDRPVNFEYITENNECPISQEADFSACGGWSRAWLPHSFKLKAKKTYYGLNSFDHQFFSQKPYLKHKVLQIRNGGNDTGCRIKDASLQKIALSSGLYVEGQAWQPVHVYLNGEHYGVLNMREPNNKDYGESNYGIDDNLMDQFEICPDSGYVQMRGTKESFRRLYTLSKTAAEEASYAEIEKLVDIDEYVNYMAVEMYLGGTDWPQNNVKGFRSVEDGKFRFVLFDLDGTFATTTPLSTFAGKQNYTFDVLKGYDYVKGVSIQGTRITKENEFVTIFLNMLKNQTFKKKFVDAFCLVAGSVYTPERVNSIVDEMASYLSQGGYVDPYYTANQVKNNLSNRLTALTNHLKSYLTLGTPITATLSSNIAEAGILVNGMDVPTGKFEGRLFAPAVISAKAPAGYKFLGWKVKGATVTKSANVFTTGESWRYSVQNLDGTNWKAATYSDTSWGNGVAPLGYGKTQKTRLTANKACYYFRKTVNLSNVSASDVYTLDYTIDDGMVVYVNGKEAGRYNMPSGTPTNSSFASTYANNNPDTGSMTIDGSFFKNGTNVIAVEVHNNSATSSDILWDASLTRAYQEEGTPNYVTTEREYTLPAGTQNLIAVWQKFDGDKALMAQADAPIKINEISAGNDSYVNEYVKKDDWVELYNTTDTDLDAAGLYLSDNASKPTKYQIKKTEGVSTIIPAHGHILVWCSKREQVSQIHASFKLGNTDGSLVMLSSSDAFVKNNAKFFDEHPKMKEFTDTLHYNEHKADQTVGRYPDGSNTYYIMNHATINKANSLQSSDLLMAKDSTYIMGDVNNDGKVDQTDAQLIMKHFLGTLPSGSAFNENAADMNDDSKITISDANMIINTK